MSVIEHVMIDGKKVTALLKSFMTIFSVCTFKQTLPKKRRRLLLEPGAKTLKFLHCSVLSEASWKSCQRGEVRRCNTIASGVPVFLI